MSDISARVDALELAIKAIAERVLLPRPEAFEVRLVEESTST